MSLLQVTTPATSEEKLFLQDEAFARAFASCATLQAEVGATGADPILECLSHVLDHESLDQDFDKARVIIMDTGGLSRVLNDTGAYISSGMLRVWLERKQDEIDMTTPTATEDYRNEKTKFKRFYGKVLTELEAVMNNQNAIVVNGNNFNPIKCRRYSIVTGPMNIPASELFPYDESAASTPDVRKDKTVWSIELELELY